MAMGTRKQRERQEELWYRRDLAEASGHPFYRRLAFVSPIPNGEWTRFLPQCGQFTSTSKGLAGLIGIYLLGPDSLSPCFFYSRRY